MNPGYGEIGGGTIVSIQGSPFYEELNLECNFNGRRVPAQVISETEIRCVTPESNVVGTTPLTITANQIPMLGPFDYEYISILLLFWILNFVFFF